jgi:hypothetical protein
LDAPCQPVSSVHACVATAERCATGR